MIFTLSSTQIDTIKNNTFPIKDGDGKQLVNLKKVDLKISGTDSLLTFYIDIKENVSSPKIFGNQTAKNLMKMLLFEVINNDMSNEVINCKTQPELEEILSKYGVRKVFINPTEEFSGDKKDINSHMIEGDYFTLSYTKELLLPESTISFFSLGIVLFNDLNTYILEKNIKPQFIEKRILMSDVQVFPLISTNIEGEEVISSLINDLRLSKSLFNNNSDSSYSLLQNINENVEIDTKNIKLLSERKLEFSDDKYFSNAYFSRNINGNLSFLFNLDYKALIKNISAYKTQILHTNLIDEFTSQINMASMKVLRRKVIKTNNSDKARIEYRNDTLTSIASGADSKKEPIFIQSVSQKNLGSIRETSVSYSTVREGSFRTFDITDFEIYGLKTGLYQYGIEITLVDNFTNYLKGLINEAQKHLLNLTEYLSETEKIVKTKKEYTEKNKFLQPTVPSGDYQVIQNLPNITSEQIGVYDALAGSFTNKFVKEYGNSKWVTMNNNAVAHFIGLLNLFGVKLATSSNGLNVSSAFVSMLEPSTATAESIMYFINTYQRFIRQIDRIAQNNRNNNAIVNYWFTNEYVDASEKIEIGYEFVQNEKKNGFCLVTTNQLESIVTANISKYTKNNLIEDSIAYNNRYKFIGPRTIKSINKIINLDDTIQDPELINQFSFAELETDIKRQNNLGDAGSIVPITNLGFMGMSTSQQQFNLRLNNIMEKYSISVPSLFKTVNKKVDDIKDYNDVKPTLDSKVDPAYLFLSLSKLTDKKSNSIIEKQKKLKFISPKSLTTAHKKKYTSTVPYQIISLAFNRARIFNKEEEYLSSLDFHSIYLLFYNTIHRIEYLELLPIRPDKKTRPFINVKNENWVPLTNEKVRSLTENSAPILCRLRIYQDQSINIDDWEQIKMPIYNKHFLLSGRTSLTNFIVRKPARFNNFTQSMRNIIDDDVSSRLQNVIKNIPELTKFNKGVVLGDKLKPELGKKFDIALTPAAGLMKTFTEKNIGNNKMENVKKIEQMNTVDANNLNKMNLNVGNDKMHNSTPPFIKNINTNSNLSNKDKPSNQLKNNPKTPRR